MQLACLFESAALNYNDLGSPLSKKYSYREVLTHLFELRRVLVWETLGGRILFSCLRMRTA